MEISVSANVVTLLPNVMRKLIYTIKGDIKSGYFGNLSHCHTASATYIRQHPDSSASLVVCGTPNTDVNYINVSHSFIAEGNSIINDTFSNSFIDNSNIYHYTEHGQQYSYPVVARFSIKKLIEAANDR